MKNFIKKIKNIFKKSNKKVTQYKYSDIFCDYKKKENSLIISCIQ